MAPDGFRSRWQMVGGLRLHALEWDGGPGLPVVLLPGLVTASRSMIPLARALAGHQMHPWILDPPGFGYSDKPRRALSIRGQAALIAGWLAAIGCRPARLLGNSFGAQVAAVVAASHPGAVGRLVLLSPTASPMVRHRLAWLRVLPPPAAPAAPVAATAPAAAATRPSGRWRARLLSGLHRALGDDPPLRILNVAEYACAGPPRAVSTLRSAVQEPIEQALPGIAAPALVIRAGQDHLSSLPWATRLASLLPDGRLAQLPGPGHDAFHAEPGTVAAVAAPFLAARADELVGRQR